jgi:DNA repair protein SbcC/Rad50
MLPLKLTISGLYSYQEKQTIDFKELTDAGLFGIFGAVGSGKSSILEAIGFVLYGETERLNSRDKRSYNMLNLKSDKAFIEFEFLNFEDKKFKFNAVWTRNKKRFEETTTVERLAYIWKETEWIPIESADATPIIGLTYDNFRRTIIIPQGKFKEFLDLKGKERSDMMKEIFHLERFDLSYKVSALQSNTKSKLDELKGALSRYEEVTKEKIVGVEQEVNLAEKELQKSKAEHELIDLEFKLLSTLKTNFEELEKKKSLYGLLLQRKPDMDKLTSEIVIFENTEKAFSELLNRLESKKIELENSKKQYDLFIAKKDITLKNIEENKTKIAVLQPLFDNLETNKIKVSELESIEKIHGFKSNLIGIDANIKNSDVLYTAAEKYDNELKDELEKLQKELSSLKTKRMNATLLFDLGNWYSSKDNFQEKLNEILRKIILIQKEIETQKELFAKLNLPFENWKEVVTSKRVTIEAKRKELNETQTKLLVSEQLAHFTTNLHEGESCPLCGALEHPNVMQAEDVSEQLKSNKLSVSQLVEQEKEITQITLDAEKFEIFFSNLKKQIETLNEEKLTTEKAIELHQSKFIWTDFQANDKTIFDSKKQEQFEIEKAIKFAEEKEKTIRLQKESQETELKKLLSNRGILVSEQATKTGAIENELSQLKKLSFSDYELISVAGIQAERVRLHQENNRIASEFDLVTAENVKQEQELSGLNGSLISIKEQLDLNQIAVNDCQNRINELVQTHQFDSIEVVQKILSKSWDIASEKAKTTQFFIDLKVAEKAVSEAEQLIENQVFDEEIFKTKQLLLTEAKAKYDAQFALLTSLQTNLARIIEDYSQKEKLQVEFETGNNRFVNLNTLANMFNASGFVNYVSSIYLQNIADIANARFHRMTKNKLSLTLNVSNEFEVIDYLNNGARRSVKTLSGGQGFQASLCLALALAESVQTLNKNDKNFFFIDEGFGTQDPESVAIVFDTLQSLYKENRIVGVISHVAELQERIPRSINVFKDEEKGSFVTESWN